MRGKQRSHADQTRIALLDAGLRLFGERGFDATSIRQIAALADTNIASVNYHFGGKEGLRLACADLIVSEFSQVANTLLGDMSAIERCSEQEASDLLINTYTQVARFLLAQDQSSLWVPFILRELMHPSSALDQIYTKMYGPLHGRLCLLWQQATGREAESTNTRLTIFSLIGQMVYFRIARPIVERRMQWSDAQTAHGEEIVSVLTDNFKLILMAAKTPTEVNHD